MTRSMLATTHVCLLALAAGTCAANASAAARPAPEVKGVVNLNAATEGQLRLLPGVGAKKAARILEQRAHHRFQSTDQLMKVKGFGRLTYRRLKPYLAVDGPTTITRPAAAHRNRSKRDAAPPPPAPDPVANHAG